MIPINEMPDHSRVWIYQSDRKFSDDEVAAIEQKLADFISNWASHGTPLKASGAVLYNRFLIILADEDSVKASGCSIDKSVAFVKQLEKELKCDFFNRLLIAYKSGDEIKTFHFAEKDELISQGKINDNTIIFNNLIQNKADLLSNWQQRLSESWLH
ncbi:MAG: ABC transporter ATPase [Bacteroidia bacterium]